MTIESRARTVPAALILSAALVVAAGLLGVSFIRGWGQPAAVEGLALDPGALVQRGVRHVQHGDPGEGNDGDGTRGLPGALT